VGKTLQPQNGIETAGWVPSRRRHSALSSYANISGSIPVTIMADV